MEVRHARAWCLAVFYLPALVCACGSTPPVSAAGKVGGVGLDPVDVLVFAPHPDDEVLGAAGVLRQAVLSGKRVRVVFVTNGDAYPRAAAVLVAKPVDSLVAADYEQLAATRQHEGVAAAALLGVNATSLLFLGYPDASLHAVDTDRTDTPVVSPTTGRGGTYGPAEVDYHTRAHGGPAPYTHASALTDIEEILRGSGPADLYVTDAADMHPDHRAVYDLVREAVSATRYRGRVLTYLIHSGSGWPWPRGATAGEPFESHALNGVVYPMGVRWPPAVDVVLTAAEADLKLRAIRAHASEWSIDGLYMESFVKSDEVFWTS